MIDKKDIEKLAELSRIEISLEEKEILAGDMDAIIEYVSEIKNVGGDLNIEPEAGILKNVMREDEDPHEKGKYTEDILREAPQKEGDYIKVKQIL